MPEMDQSNRAVSFSGLTADQSKEILTLLGDAVAVAHEVVGGSRLALQSKPTKSLSLMLLYNMAEKGGAVHQLSGNGLSSGVEAIVRSMFETHIDLQNLHNYPEHYPNYLFAAATLNQRKQLDVLIRSGESRWKAQARRVATLSANSTLEDIRTEKDAELQDLVSQLPDKFLRGKAKKTLETNIEARSRWAELHHEYDQIYRYLSAMSHSDMIAVTGQASEHVSKWWPPERKPCPGIAIYTASKYVIQAIGRVTKKLKLSRHKANSLDKRLTNWLSGDSSGFHQVQPE